MTRLAAILLTALCLNACAAAQRPGSAGREALSAQAAAIPGLTRWLSGSGADARPGMMGPALLLAGGDSDQVAAMQWQIDAVRGCSDCERRVDLVVLRASGADGYNGMLSELTGLDSIETLLLTDRRAAEHPAVAATVAAAEIVFFAGGDQCQYVSLFKGTRLEAAVESVVARGGGAGGTSAGLAIQGSLIYDACRGSVSTPEALADPFHPSISFSSGLFPWPALQGLITDTHFAQRDRMGRLMAFLARGLSETRASSLRGLAVDEATAIGLDARGQGQVFGRHHAYLVEARPDPAAVLAPGQPLSHANYRIQRLNPGQRFELKAPLPNQALRVDVRAGKLSDNPY